MVAIPHKFLKLLAYYLIVEIEIFLGNFGQKQNSGKNEMKAAEIMTTKVLTINNLATVAEAIAKMQTSKVRSLIVKPTDEEDAYGIITQTDIIYKVTARENPEEVMVYQIMTKPCIVVNRDLSIKNVARLFAETGIQRTPVIQKQLLGMISVTDIMMKLKVSQQLSDKISAKIQKALLHSRVFGDRQKSIDRDCEVAWDVIERLQTE